MRRPRERPTVADRRKSCVGGQTDDGAVARTTCTQNACGRLRRREIVVLEQDLNSCLTSHFFSLRKEWTSFCSRPVFCARHFVCNFSTCRHWSFRATTCPIFRPADIGHSAQHINPYTAKPRTPFSTSPTTYFRKNKNPVLHFSHHLLPPNPSKSIPPNLSPQNEGSCAVFSTAWRSFSRSPLLPPARASPQPSLCPRAVLDPPHPRAAARRGARQVRCAAGREASTD